MMSRFLATPSPRRGEGWGEGVTASRPFFSSAATPSPGSRFQRDPTSPRRNSGVPEFRQIINWPKSETSDFGWGEVKEEQAASNAMARHGCRVTSDRGDSHAFQSLHQKILRARRGRFPDVGARRG